MVGEGGWVDIVKLTLTKPASKAGSWVWLSLAIRIFRSVQNLFDLLNFVCMNLKIKYIRPYVEFMLYT